MTRLLGQQLEWYYSLPAPARLASEAALAAGGCKLNAVRPWIVIPEGGKMGGPQDNSDDVLRILKASCVGLTCVFTVTPIQLSGMTQARWEAAALIPPATVTAYAEAFVAKFGSLISAVEIGNETGNFPLYWSASATKWQAYFATFAAVLRAHKIPVLSSSWNGLNFTEMQKFIDPIAPFCDGITLHPYSPTPGDFISQVKSRYPGKSIYITELGSHQQSATPAQWAAGRAQAIDQCSAADVDCIIDYPGPQGTRDEGAAGIVTTGGVPRQPYFGAFMAAGARFLKGAPSPGVPVTPAPAPAPIPTPAPAPTVVHVPTPTPVTTPDPGSALYTIEMAPARVPMALTQLPAPVAATIAQETVGIPGATIWRFVANSSPMYSAHFAIGAGQRAVYVSGDGKIAGKYTA